jgi:hypothetical protein
VPVPPVRTARFASELASTGHDDAEAVLHRRQVVEVDEIAHGSRYGAIGLTVTVICAVLYVTVPAVLAGIIGSGC